MEKFSETQTQEQAPKRYVVVSFLETPPHSFDTSVWPLHVTIVRPFSSTLTPDLLYEKLKTVCTQHSPIPIVGESREMFGEQNDIPVTQLVENGTLQRLHNNLLAAYENQIQLFGPRYRAYIPHVTEQRNERLEIGGERQLTTISLVEIAGETRQVLENIILGEQHSK